MKLRLKPISLMVVAVFVAGALPQNADAQVVRRGLSITPALGFSAVSQRNHSDLEGPLAAAEVSWRARNVVWTPLEVSAQFPAQGGYVKLAAGASVFIGSSYLGVLGGVSRFDPDQTFLGARIGVAMPFLRETVTEVRVEHHYRDALRTRLGGTSASMSLRLPVALSRGY